MKIRANTISFCACILLLVTGVAYAQNNKSVEFFASNNTNEISLKTAYKRLLGQHQKDLRNEVIYVFQENHLEQSRQVNILGAYQMSHDKKVTADNSEKIITSPYEKLTNKKVFLIAKQLAERLNQESVAVLLPVNDTVAEVSVIFNSNKPRINKLINLLHMKLPEIYSQAFSLKLVNTCGGFENSKVAEIDWLGNKIKPNEIKNVFPTERMSVGHGKVFLVYKNGRKEKI